VGTDAPMTTTIEIQGVTVPKLGFGTWQITGRDCYEAVRHALEIGYRHIDTARAYGNEREVGQAIADSSPARDDVFLTTKIWPDDHAPDRLRAAAEDSLRTLGVEAVDLVLLHWPSKEHPLEATVEALSKLREDGLSRLIGVSNFPPSLLRDALRAGPIANDQVEFHPYLGQDALLEIADEHELFVTAYAPLAHGKVADDPMLAEIGQAHGKTPGQVALRYLLDKDRVVAVPKSNTPERRQENFEVFDFELSAEETGSIDALPKDQRDFSPDFGPDSWD
jgi:2,5-diketo-D-gluconate reductase B